MTIRQWLLTISSVVTLSAVLLGALPSPPPAEGGRPAADDDFDDRTPDPPLPRGIKERVFIHLPRAHKPGHLGTCTPTDNDSVTDYGLAGWRLPAGGITWRLNPATIPPTVNPAAEAALTFAFGTWTASDPQKIFLQGPDTTVTRSRFDGINAVLWGKVAGNAIGVTYVRYSTVTGVVVDVDTVFNKRLPWAVFADGAECQNGVDAYDVQNIATHEFGHWIGLDDLYSSADRDLTMYGYGAGGELKKRTLGPGDASGSNELLP